VPHSSPPLTEPMVVHDVYVSELARVENIGEGIFRFTFVTKQASIHDNHMERVVVARLLMPAAAISDAMLATEMALSGIGGAVGKTVVEIKH